MEVLQVLVSTFTPAAVVGLVALLRSVRADRRSMLLQLVNSLLEPEVQEGRRLIYIYLAKYPDRLWTDLPDDDATREGMELINRALALYDTAGWYAQNRYIPKRALLENWAVSILRCWHRAYTPYVQPRREREGWQGWSYFEWLAAEAEKDLRRRGLNSAINSARAPQA